MERLEKYALENNVPIMQKDGINFLCDYIKKNQVKTVLEIGTAIGYSAICMAKKNKNIQITSIERNEDMYNIALQNIKDYQVENQISIINDDAKNVEITKKYDLIFIDAAKAQYINFFEKFKDNLNDNGVIVSDNLDFHGTLLLDENTLTRGLKGIVRKLKKYIEFLKENQEFETHFYKIGDGISISRRRKG